LEPAALYRRRLSAGVLSQLSRLSEILPALGAGARPQPQAGQFRQGRGWALTILAVTGLKREAEIVGGPGVVAVTGGGDAISLQQKLDALHGDIKGVISV